MNKIEQKTKDPPPIIALGKYDNYSKNSLVSKLKFYTMGYLIEYEIFGEGSHIQPIRSEKTVLSRF